MCENIMQAYWVTSTVFSLLSPNWGEGGGAYSVHALSRGGGLLERGLIYFFVKLCDTNFLPAQMGGGGLLESGA